MKGKLKGKLYRTKMTIHRTSIGSVISQDWVYDDGNGKVDIHIYDITMWE